MDESKWPALAIEGLLLGAAIAFIAAGRDNLWMIVSLAIVLFILTLQGTSKNNRFLYLYPVKIKTGVRTTGFDTWIIRLCIVSAVFFLFWGAFGSWRYATVVVAPAFAVGVLWDLLINEPHQNWIDKRAAKKANQQPDA